MIRAFAVIGEVEAGLFVVLGRPEANGGFQRVGEHCGADDREHQRDPDRFDLLDPQRFADDVLEIQVEVRVDRGGGENAGQEGAERAADGVNAEGVERIVVAELGFELGAGEEGDDSGKDADDYRAGRRDEACTPV